MSEPETFLDGRVTLHCGDSREVLRAIPDASIHAVVTDPPYALVSIGKRFGKEGAAPAQHGRDGAYARASAGFMGKQWDTGETAFAVEFWCEVLRVLKPGGHVVAFSGTRTYHRMACAIEDAGFEIRDQLGWLYGTGFPKSHNIGKAIDRAAGAERPVIGRRPDHVVSAAWREQEGRLDRPDSILNITAAATDEARQWGGWGTALKPSYEPLVLAQKPWPYSTEWVTIASDLDRLEAQLWSMLSAKDAGMVLPSSQAAFAEAMSASAAWLAESGSSIRADLSALMGMSQFVSATISSLSTVSSWKDIWADLSDPESMSTIETASKTTIDWRTLKFSLSKITPATIIPAHNSGRWSNVDACPAGRYFNATLSMLDATRERFALASAIDLWQRHSPAEGAPSPSWEPIILARKPLEGTAAANVLAHGTGALNIDACRIEAGDKTPAPVGQFGGSEIGPTGLRGVRDGAADGLGRWPANIVHDGSPDVLAAFPETSSGTGAIKRASAAGYQGNALGRESREAGTPMIAHGDSGSAARFFYSAKADADDRLGSKHPTVKPVDLMQWLCRLVTPKQVLECPQCDSLGYDASPKKANTDSPMCSVPEALQAEGQWSCGEILQPDLRGAGEEASAGPLPVVRDHVSAPEGWGAAVLQQDLRGPMDGEEPFNIEGICNQQGGLQAPVDAGASAIPLAERVHLRASVGNAADDRSSTNPARGGAPQERRQARQSAGKLGTDDKGGSRQAEPSSSEHAVLPPLPGDDHHQPTCAHCGHLLEYRPGRILDPFAGTGTTGEAAWREGFSAVLVEREAEYQADIRRRMKLALGGPDERKRESIKARHGHVEAGPLFSNLGAAE